VIILSNRVLDGVAVVVGVPEQILATGIGLLEPVFVPVWVFLAWGHKPAWWTLVGGGLILIGLVVRYALPTGRQSEDK